LTEDLKIRRGLSAIIGESEHPLGIAKIAASSSKNLSAKIPGCPSKPPSGAKRPQIWDEFKCNWDTTTTPSQRPPAPPTERALNPPPEKS